MSVISTPNVSITPPGVAVGVSFTESDPGVDASAMPAVAAKNQAAPAIEIARSSFDVMLIPLMEFASNFLSTFSIGCHIR
ncbi:MAG: hypothetical protein J0I96_00095 [Rhodanobacter sp.]|nr:hypothetical protein [Rhodanobacter sp.]